MSKKTSATLTVEMILEEGAGALKRRIAEYAKAHEMPVKEAERYLFAFALSRKHSLDKDKSKKKAAKKASKKPAAKSAKKAKPAKTAKRAKAVTKKSSKPAKAKPAEKPAKVAKPARKAMTPEQREAKNKAARERRAAKSNGKSESTAPFESPLITDVV